jgi:hypothetical protein
MEIYFDADYATIRYDKSTRILSNVWKMPPLSSEFRTYMLALVAAMDHFKTGKVLENLVKFGTLHPDDQHWATTDWFEMAVNVGYTHIAFVLPGDAYTQMAIEDTMSPVEGKVTFRYFDNTDAAETWIIRA